MKLYVLGPAFGLPSIDAECIAAVALLKLSIEEWTVIPTHDQTRPLPYLLHADKHITGYKPIARHILSTKPSAFPSLDPTLNADSTALLTFLTTHAQPLLDISLYLSFDNYTTTRTAFTTILPWHANYSLPPARRKAARHRTQHLGLSSLDVDDVHEDLSNRPPGLEVGKPQEKKTFEAATQERASRLFRRPGTVRGLLRQAQGETVFKLHALAENFFGPLQDMLGDGEYFLDGESHPRELDCLAYGYLSLMLYPPLPNDWLAQTMRKKYLKLVRFTERMHETLALHTDAGEVISLNLGQNEDEIQALREACHMTLPWEPPKATSVMDVATQITTDLFSRVPFFGSYADPTTTYPPGTSYWRRHFSALITVTAASLGLLGYYGFASGALVWPHGEAMQIFGKRRLADYGHLGAALAGVSLLGLGQQATGGEGWNADLENPTPVRVEVDVEGVEVP